MSRFIDNINNHLRSLSLRAPASEPLTAGRFTDSRQMTPDLVGCPQDLDSTIFLVDVAPVCLPSRSSQPLLLATDPR